MDSKKPGVLRNLRQKMMPHLLRSKKSSSKSPVHLEHTMDHRMSSSVPDIRYMRHEYSHVCSSPPLQQYNAPSYSSPSSPLVKPDRRLAGGGSGLRMEAVDGGSGRSEHRLSVPVDSTDWASSQESFNSLCEEEKSSPERIYRPAGGMEAEELALPEMITVYSPEPPSVEASQDSSQVTTLHLTISPKKRTHQSSKHKQRALYNVIKVKRLHCLIIGFLLR